jgi:hypothetical protein
MKTQFSWDGYWKPTPIILRKIGDALLGAFSIVSVSSVITEHKELAIASLVIGVLGKILSNFFSDSPVAPEEEQQD